MKKIAEKSRSVPAAACRTRCAGPIMLVHLRGPGNRRVTAQAKGRRRQQAVATSCGRTARATFVWPAGTS